MEEHTAHFTVCGEGLTNIVRQMYCYEGKQFQALEILDGLEGITISQAKNVCTGKARLEDREGDNLIYYVEEPDQQFIAAYADHNVWLETHLQEEFRELESLMRNVQTPRMFYQDTEETIAIGKRIARGELDLVNKRYALELEQRKQGSRYGSPHIDNLAKIGMLGKALRAAYPDAYADEEDEEEETQSLEAMAESLTNTGMFNDPVIPEPSKETVKVGRFDVPKNLIDRYSLHVVKRIRKSIRNRDIPDSIDGVTELYNLEMERQKLHDAICKALGFDHDAEHGKRSRDQVDFDMALQDYLDEHAGKLFSGEE